MVVPIARSLPIQLAVFSSLILAISDHPRGLFASTTADPICAARDQWFCSPNDFDSPATQEQVFSSLAGTSKYLTKDCHEPTQYPRGDGGWTSVYEHMSCDTDDRPDCYRCFYTAITEMRRRCPNRDGAQFAPEHCCVRYETYKFC